MAQIDVNTLLMAIQAIEAQGAALACQLDATDNADDATDIEDMLLGYSKASEELRLAYEAEARHNPHLPTYDILLRGAVSRPVYPSLQPQTLVVVIQSLQADIKALQDDVMDEAATPDECQMFEDFTLAADDLQRVYTAMAKTIINLPPYNQLVR